MKRKKTIESKRPFIPRPDFRNIERGKAELADMIRESEKRDEEKRCSASAAAGK